MGLGAEWEVVVELGGMGEGENVVGMYYMKEESIFSKMKPNSIINNIGHFQILTSPSYFIVFFGG